MIFGKERYQFKYNIRINYFGKNLGEDYRMNFNDFNEARYRLCATSPIDIDVDVDDNGNGNDVLSVSLLSLSKSSDDSSLPFHPCTNPLTTVHSNDRDWGSCGHEDHPLLMNGTSSLEDDRNYNCYGGYCRAGESYNGYGSEEESRDENIARVSSSSYSQKREDSCTNREAVGTNLNSSLGRKAPTSNIDSLLHVLPPSSSEFRSMDRPRDAKDVDPNELIITSKPIPISTYAYSHMIGGSHATFPKNTEHENVMNHDHEVDFRYFCKTDDLPVNESSRTIFRVDERPPTPSCHARKSPAWNSKTTQPILLSMPTDENILSQMLCLVRKQIEIFTATHAHTKAPAPGRKSNLKVGQVGLRCIHCVDDDWKVKRAQIYPNEISKIYRAIIDMNLDHFSSCPRVPADIKLRLEEFRKLKSRSNVSTRKYIQDSARMLGLVDSEDSIGVFYEPALFKGNRKLFLEHVRNQPRAIFKDFCAEDEKKRRMQRHFDIGACVHDTNEDEDVGIWGAKKLKQRTKSITRPPIDFEPIHVHVGKGISTDIESQNIVKL